MMIGIDITPSMIKKAQSDADSVGVLNNSILQGKGTLAGKIGEEIAVRSFGAEIVDSYSYDVMMQGKKVEIKTKRRKRIPESDYEVSIARTSAHQALDADTYLFISLTMNGDIPVKGWVCGEMPVSEYFDRARLIRKGEIDHSNNFVCQTDMYNMFISELYPVELPVFNEQMTMGSILEDTLIVPESDMGKYEH